MPRDALTGLVGSETVRERLSEWQPAHGADGVAPVHAMLLGLGRFDTVNLAYGEAAGDSALVEVAARLNRLAAEELQGEWVLSRIGGGSFLLAANEACSRERWQWLAETLADTIAKPITNLLDDNKLRLWPRVALMRPLEGEGPQTILDRLAETLGGMSRERGARVLWADGELAMGGRSAAQLEADLLGALDRDEIEIFYQPQFSTSDDSLVGAEALARWDHPTLGRVGAGTLFAIAERADHTAQLSRHIAVRALSSVADWPEHLRLSLNVTPSDLSAKNFAAEFMAVLAESGFDPAALTLEITEQSLLSDVEGTTRALESLCETGIRVALDDFGAGFCNFRYLKLLPLDYLKLDKAMVDGILDDERDLAVFRAITAMARALDLKVIAEGIETAEQRDLVAREGAQTYQGFLKAEPMSAADFSKLAN